MKQISRNIIVRSWQIEDNKGVWSVLKDGSYSNIMPAFAVVLRKPLLWGINVLIFCLGQARGLSPMCLVLCFLIELIVIYAISAFGAVVYLYGEILSDINDIKTSYFMKPDHHFWVAECDGEIAGTVAIVRKTSPLKGAPDESSSVGQINNKSKVAWLRRMAVTRKFRGLGIAKQLVRTSIEFCRSQEYDSIFLITTEVQHAARSLYSSLGFQLMSSRPYRYLNGLVTVETFEFEMKLK